MKPITGGCAVLQWLVLLCFFGVTFAQVSDEDDDDPFKDFKKCPGGYCVDMYLCVNNSILSEGEGIVAIGERFNDIDLIDVSIDEADNVDNCLEFLKKCCPHESRGSPVPVMPAKLIGPQTELPPLIPPPASCGRGHPNGYIYRVTKNSDAIAQYGEFPWTAGLFREDPASDDLQYFCAGSLVHAQVVLTVAHCLRNFSAPDGLTVRLGDWDIANANEPQKHKDFAVRKIIKHPDWHPIKYHNDLALLILEKQATLGSNINTICLPTVDDSFDGRRCVAVGWGKDVKKNAYAEVLKKVELPVVANKACQRMLRRTVLGPIFQLHSGFLCAGGEDGVDMCKGDGGAPLMCDNGDGTYVQAGIVAWGIGCATVDAPGVYVKVAKFVDWIEGQIATEGLE